MAVTRDDLVFVKSATVTDTDNNGGRKSYIEVPNRARFNLFPRVTRPERMNGKTRYRKEFLWNKNASNEIAYGVLAYILYPSPAGDRFYLAEGTQTDTQGDIDDSYKWYGGGALHSDVTAGATQISVEFESDDFHIANGMTIAINSHFLVGQTIMSGVRAFDAVKFDSAQGMWVKESAPDADSEDVYPYGTYLGDNKVFSYNDNGELEYLTVANEEYTGEVIGTGDGNTKEFTDTLEHPPVAPNTVTVYFTIEGATYSGSDDGSGSISGAYISSGSINYTTGLINLTFTTAPDNGTNMTCNYTKQAYSWSGNVCTIDLMFPVANDYLASNTYVGACVAVGDIKPSISDVTVNSTNGTFDYTLITEDNRGTVEDDWTITFTSSTEFTCSGANEGSVGSGNITSSFSPTNPNTGQPYFTIPPSVWGGAWTSGDTVTFKTHPAAAPLWWKEVVPAGTGPYSDNGVMLEVYVE